MAILKKHAYALIADEEGGEVFEYAIIAGLISVVAISMIAAFGVKVLARWNTVTSSL